MNNFNFQNPTRIIFGKGTIKKLSKQIPKGSKVMLLYGGGSIKSNGVYNQIMVALKKFEVVEFSGIEPNPEYETLIKAVEIVKKKKIDFLVAAGGGSVIDGTKFVAIASRYKGKNPWNLLKKGKANTVKKALPLGTVLTLPATGSEMNMNAVISRRETQEKLAFGNPIVYPQFSILDPETTYSLPQKYIRNGIVDAFVHIIEQYLTYPVGGLVQDRQAEALLLSLMDCAPLAMQDPPDYVGRANFMWAATNALNHLISAGVPGDWSTHDIGHEITAFYGLDHAETLALILPYLMWYQRNKKKEKLLQFGKRVFGLRMQSHNERISQTIEHTAAFFQSLGMPTTLTAYGIDPDEAAEKVKTRFEERGSLLGEHKDIGPEDVAAILRMSR